MDTTTAQVTADLQAIFLGKKDIQDDQIVGRQFCEILSFLPIIGDIDAVSFMSQICCQRAAQSVVVFYYKNAHGKPSFPFAHRTSPAPTPPTSLPHSSC